MLGVLLLLAILFTITGSVIGTVQRKAQASRARADANALVQAVLHYRQVYGEWPPYEDALTLASSPYIPGIGGYTNLFPWLNLPASRIDQSDILSALAPNSPHNPRGILFLTIPTDALIQGRLVDPWEQPYLLVMDAQQQPFAIQDLAFSNLPAFAISAGAPVANPDPDNWIFSAGVRP